MGAGLAAANIARKFVIVGAPCLVIGDADWEVNVVVARAVAEDAFAICGAGPVEGDEPVSLSGAPLRCGCAVRAILNLCGVRAAAKGRRFAGGYGGLSPVIHTAETLDLDLSCSTCPADLL